MSAPERSAVDRVVEGLVSLAIFVSVGIYAMSSALWIAASSTGVAEPAGLHVGTGVVAGTAAWLWLGRIEGREATR